jgi:hypothetical protein
MKKIVEYVDGFRWVDGNTSSAPFTKDSNQYSELITEGCKVELILQATKDAHEQAEAINQAVSSVQTMLDSEAASRGYDNINAIAKYMGYDNQFRAECEALGAWCAACWAKCYELQGGGVMPDDLIAEMPVLVA